MPRPLFLRQAALCIGVPYICRACRLTPRIVALPAAHRSFANSGLRLAKGKKQKAEPAYDPTIPPTIDHRNRLSNFFIPTGGIAAGADKDEDTHSLLIRAGYVRQAHTGIFHLLPLGQRVHEKLERLIDKHMRAVGASKLALSTISSEALWSKSGRLAGAGQELMRFRDRKDTKYVLSPTHEEEITALVGSVVNSYRQLPLRLYQIGRKYRDEKRPRAGLLRGKEFTMKDLYTFDINESTAIVTYNDICNQYRALLSELKIPFIVAEADSGNMGGTLSHEYHLPSPSGEDVVIGCTSCSYAANEACAQSRHPPSSSSSATSPDDQFEPEVAVFHGITNDRNTLINVFYPKYRQLPIDPSRHQIEDVEESRPRRSMSKGNGNLHINEVNPHRIKDLIPDYDPSVHAPIELFHEHFTEYDSTTQHIPPRSPSSNPDSPSPQELPKYSQIINIYDQRLLTSTTSTSFANHSSLSTHFFASKDIPTTTIDLATHTTTSGPDSTGKRLDLLKIKEGDLCPRCEAGSLTLTNAIELGHTFHLGTRYSVPLSAKASSHLPEDEGKLVPLSMGCHGIGVSRMIPAIAETFRDDRGLMWPRVIAPFEVCIIGKKGEGMEDVYDILTTPGGDEVPGSEEGIVEGGKVGWSGRRIEAILDDREKSLVWKMNDADLIGYPVVLVLGRAWSSDSAETGDGSAGNGGAERKVEVQCRTKGLVGKDKSLLVEVGYLRKVVGGLLDEL